MKKLHVKVLIASYSVVFAGGCAFFKPNGSAQLVTLPVANVAHSASVDDANYQMGRAYQGRLQYDAAIAAYRKSLKENPRNAEAHNALGVIYAMQGKPEQAVTELMAALALAPAPAASHIHNNLGYAYLLNGRTADAMAALKIAAGMDPANARVQENLKSAEKRLGPEPPNPQILPAASAVDARVKPPMADKNVDPAAPTLVSVAPNIFELRQGLPRINPGVPSISPVSPIAVKLEVTNGNGVTGLAKRTSSFLQQKGYAVARLTNQVPYTQAITEIQYRRGQENQARRLNSLLAVSTNMVESSRLSPAVGVRIVLGRDIVQQSLFTESSNRQYGIANEEASIFKRG